jgi:hypothetical protein
LRANPDLGILPIEFADVVSPIDVAYLRQDDHTADPSFDLSGSTHKGLLLAVTDGRVTCEAAVAEFVNRLPMAADKAEREEIRDFMGGLKDLRVVKGASRSREDDVKGNLLYLWAAVAKKVQNLGGGVISAGGDSTIIAEIEKLMASDSDSGRRVAPRLSIVRLDNEAKFDAAVMQWSLLTNLVGVMNSTIQSKFLWSVAFLTRHHADLDFWAAQEYLIACLDLLDRKVCTVETVANYDRNIMLSTASRLGAMQESAASGSKATSAAGGKSTAGTATNKKAWNGKATTNPRAKVCPIFNGKAGGVHQPNVLDKSGTCVFRHICNQYVDDKGAGGMCEGAHSRICGPCDYDTAHVRSTPLP